MTTTHLSFNFYLKYMKIHFQFCSVFVACSSVSRVCLSLSASWGRINLAWDTAKMSRKWRRKKFLIDCSFLPEILIIWKQQRENFRGEASICIIYSTALCIFHESICNGKWLSSALVYTLAVLLLLLEELREWKKELITHSIKYH